mmetsp:Transcript_6952/g.20857  ORF Transcript_6952/g.20857 Transcript_6952/m.20857 type:complete len:246 (+) Transcript_6952:1139-1876(+)
MSNNPCSLAYSAAFQLALHASLDGAVAPPCPSHRATCTSPTPPGVRAPAADRRKSDRRARLYLWFAFPRQWGKLNTIRSNVRPEKDDGRSVALTPKTTSCPDAPPPSFTSSSSSPPLVHVGEFDERIVSVWSRELRYVAWCTSRSSSTVAVRRIPNSARSGATVALKDRSPSPHTRRVDILRPSSTASHLDGEQIRLSAASSSTSTQADQRAVNEDDAPAQVGPRPHGVLLRAEAHGLASAVASR